MKESSPYLKTEVAKTYKKFGGNTCNDSDACEQKECTPHAELGLLFLLLMLFLGAQAARSITCRIAMFSSAGFNIRSRSTWSPFEDLTHTEDGLSDWWYNTLRIYNILTTELL